MFPTLWVNASWIHTSADRSPAVARELLVCSFDPPKWPYSTGNTSASCQRIAFRASRKFGKIANGKSPGKRASDRGKLVESSACPTAEGDLEIRDHPALSRWTLCMCYTARREQTDAGVRSLLCIHTSPLSPSGSMQRTGRSTTARE
jgi:hypothetical protein